MEWALIKNPDWRWGDEIAPKPDLTSSSHSILDSSDIEKAVAHARRFHNAVDSEISDVIAAFPAFLKIKFTDNGLPIPTDKEGLLAELIEAIDDISKARAGFKERG